MRLAGGQNCRSDGESRCSVKTEFHFSLSSGSSSGARRKTYIPALEPALIGVFIRHSSNFYSETQ
jgi:hypothetical protein